MLTAIFYFVFTALAFRMSEPARIAPPPTFDASAAAYVYETTPDAPCFIFVNENGDVADRCG